MFKTEKICKILKTKMNTIYSALSYDSDTEENEVPLPVEETEVVKSNINTEDIAEPDEIFGTSGMMTVDELTDDDDTNNFCLDDYVSSYWEHKYMEILRRNSERVHRSSSDLDSLALCRNHIENAKNDNPLIGEAMEFLFERMRKYHIVLPLKKMSVHRDADFLSYLPPNIEKFFTRECYHTEGDYQGDILSMWSWYCGKREDGKPQYLYITTFEGYGSCSYCDHVQSVEGELLTLKYVSENAMKKSTEFFKQGLKAEVKLHQQKCFDAMRLYRETCESNVLSTFRRLHFFTTYKDAKKFITDRAEEKVDFKKREKFIKKHAPPVFNDANFPTLPVKSTKK